MEIRLKTLTPIWTGGVEGESDRLHETGIIGSLRWWYEAIVRGLGGEACDPTDHTCVLNVDKFHPPQSNDSVDWRQALLHAGVCDACQSYGATGWARRYRLRLGEANPVNFSGTLNIRPRGTQQQRGWFLGPGLWGSITGQVIPKSHFDPAILVVPLELVGQWGAIGGRTQHGYGVVQPELLNNESVQVSQRMLEKLPGGANTADKNMPSLRNMFFTKLTFRTRSTDWWKKVNGLYTDTKLNAWRRTGSVPVSPTIRNYIRFTKGLGLVGKGAENYIFGSAEPVCMTCYQKVGKQGNSYYCPSCGRISDSRILERVKTKIHISAAYPLYENSGEWQVRLWGWIPCTLPKQMKVIREDVVRPLYDLVSKPEMWSKVLGNQIIPRSMRWREFASSRDKTTGEDTDIYAFLHSLLIEEVQE